MQCQFQTRAELKGHHIIVSSIHCCERLALTHQKHQRRINQLQSLQLNYIRFGVAMTRRINCALETKNRCKCQGYPWKNYVDSVICQKSCAVMSRF